MTGDIKITSGFKIISYLKKIDYSSIIGFFVGVAISALLVFFFKENPASVLKVLGGSFLQSKYDMGLTLFYTTCFAFAGLAFSIPFKAGLFHIGAEGQIVFSAMIAAVIGNSVVSLWGSVFGYLLIILITVLSGILAAQVIAAFKVYKQGHEVVVAIMLNFILSAFATYIVLRFYQNPLSQNPESALILESYRGLKDHDIVKNFFEQSAVSVFLFIAVLSCVAIWFFENKTKWGLELRSYGENPLAAQRMNISPVKVNFIALGLAGVFSSLVALAEVLGSAYQFKVGFSPAYGFLGIVVALMAQGHSIGILVSAFIMAVLHKGASDLDLETQYLTRDFSKVLQSIIIFCVAGAVYINHLRKKRS